MAEPAPFHDRDGFIWLDKELVPWREANIHVLSHALHYGSAVFEGLRAYGGEIFKLTEHSQRLMESARVRSHHHTCTCLNNIGIKLLLINFDFKKYYYFYSSSR